MEDNKQNTGENQSKTLYQGDSVTETQKNVKNYEPLSAEELYPSLKTQQEDQNYSKIDNENPSNNQKTINLGVNDKKKYFIFGGLILFFLIVFIFLIRYFFLSAQKDKEIQLTYWGLWEENTVMQPIIDQYQNKNPNIKIKYQKMDPNGYRDKLIVRSQQKNGPDIFRFHNTWIPEIKDVLSPIPNKIMSAFEFDVIFYKIFQKDLKIGNNYYGIPLMLDGLVMVYNEDLFNNAGIKNQPETWEDIINNIGQLTVKDKDGKIVTSGIALGTASNIDHFSDIFCLFLLQNGADLTKLDTPEAYGALESYRKFAEQPENYWDESMPNSIDAFIQEKVAMIIVPSWEILKIASTNSNLKFRVIPVPKLPQSTPLSVATYWAEGVSKYSDGIKQVEAWKFLKFLSEKETMTKINELQSNSRLFGTAFSRVDLGPISLQNKYLKPVIEQAEYYKSTPGMSATHDNGLNDEIIQYIENAINATINGESYESALKTAKEGIDQILNRYSN